jgi:hypothetical protein
MLRISEGKRYKFLVEKELKMPDHSRHFLLIGPDSNKYLVPVRRYSHYGIIAGTFIKCRVDRINCKGEIFLEPQNPWYSEGKSYPFEVSGIEERIDNSGVNCKVIVVLDRAGNKISVPLTDSAPLPDKGTLLNLTVEKITKGKVHLITVSRAMKDRSLKDGLIYEFVIERVEKGMDDEEYFVIKDPFGNTHTIAREYYEYYGYSAGSLFKGKVVKFKNSGEITIEPVNPFYKTGSVLKMKVTSVYESLINPSFTINLKDKFGFTHCIEAISKPAGKSVLCKVLMIKKGKPLLELL